MLLLFRTDRTDSRGNASNCPEGDDKQLGVLFTRRTNGTERNINNSGNCFATDERADIFVVLATTFRNGRTDMKGRQTIGRRDQHEAIAARE